MRLSIQYYALLKDERGLDAETVDCDAANPRELYAWLQSQHGLTLPNEALKVAINDHFSDWDQALSEGDNIVFIPPVAGG